MKKYSLEDLIYLAGFFDGEGSVILTRDKNRIPYRYSIDMQVANSYLNTLKWLKEKFGGNVLLKESAGSVNSQGIKSTKDQFRWVLRSNEIRILLPDLIPHLKEKKNQAILLQEYINKQGHYGGRGNNRPEWYIKWQEEMYQKMLALHKNSDDNNKIYEENNQKSIFEY